MEPKKYFEDLKSKKEKMTQEDLVGIYNNCLNMLVKYKQTGQHKAAKKILFIAETIEREKEVLELGIDTFVHYEDIEDYIDNVSKKVVKIIELKNYERDIPDNIVEVIKKVGDKFDMLYVIFTDYTGKIEKQVEKERIEKDPILFGTFQNKENKTMMDRFYFLGDWEDEFCDLTLDKIAYETRLSSGKDVIHQIFGKKEFEDMKRTIRQIEEFEAFENERIRKGRSIDNNKKTFFSKIISFFK